MLKINYFATGNSITLYWEKPADLPKGYCFLVYVDGKKAGENPKTHFTIRQLQADTVYKIQIALLGEDVAEKFVSEEMLLVTRKEKRKLDVTKAPYLAVGDGVNLNTKALQQAMDDCDGDSVVYFPAGIFMTGALRLHSDMEVYLEEGAVLQGTAEPEDYLPRIHSRFEGYEMECYSSLLNMGELDHKAGYNCKNVLIHGKGTIASGGRTLAQKVIDSERERLKAYIESLGDEINTYENFDTIPGRVRPRLINISNCQNIVISGLKLENGASWNVHMIYSDSIVTHDCTFRSENVWNGDGWDPDSSTNCTIFDCMFYTGDDSVAIKSGKNPEGNVINRPCDCIRIFDCRCAYGHGITMGSEMSGGIRDVKIWDCDMSRSVYGIEIKGTKKRGGYVREIHVKDSKVSRILFHSVGYNDDGVAAPIPPVFERCSFENMQIYGEYTFKGERHTCEAIELAGFDVPGHQIRDIFFKNILISCKEEDAGKIVVLKNCENITLENVKCMRGDF